LIERHLHFELSRFDGLVQKAVVTVQQVVGGKECHVQLRLRSGVNISTRECSGDLASATRTAARRLANALDRHVALHRPTRLARASAQM
jgi:hypothetical protein